jgi:virginiamycin B lyase
MNRKPQILSRIVGVALVVLALSLPFVRLLSADKPSRQPALTERQRYGFVATSPNWPQKFDVSQLKAGWYVDATLPDCSLAPDGMEGALLLPVHSGYTLNAAWLGPLVDNHPGSMWLIGNEPDCINQDNVWPEEYARIYHDLYTFIKGRDPTAVLSPGGVVQPTPLRLAWLDRVLAKYQLDYGQPMPVDVWNIHNAILNEVRNEAGADIPPGFPEVEEGVRRDPQDNDNKTIFEQQIFDFREWMAAQGYAGYPLIITEYGILMPELWYGYDEARVNAFMTATFDFLSTAQDADLGDPSDGYRLVQRWAWFSLDVPPYDPVTGMGFNGNLFDPATGAITGHGVRYASHIVSLGPLSYVDLIPGRVRTVPAFKLAQPGQPISRTLQVEVTNEGTVDAGSFLVILEAEGQVHEQLIAALPAASSAWITFTLTDLQPGVHAFFVSLDPARQVVESIECNNQTGGTVLAPTDQAFLSLVAHGSLFRVPGDAQGPSPSQLLVSSWPFVSRRARSLVPTTLEMGLWDQAVALQGSEDLSATTKVPHQPAASEFSRSRGFREFSMPTASSHPAQLALDPVRQVLWVTERDGNQLAAFDLSTETWIGEYTIPTPGSQPWGVAIDSSGDVWFAETAADQIGMLDVATGDITEPVILAPGSEPWGVAVKGAGSNLTVWFTERGGNKIGKFVPPTMTVEYTLPAPDSQPSGIAIRGDSLWFTESAVGRLGRLDLQTGEIREFPGKLSPPLEGPQDVTVSSSGNPWLSESEGDRITLFYFSTLQNFIPIPLASSGSEPYGMAIEGEKAVWFTERTGNKLGRYTGPIPPDEYPLPTSSSLPTDVVVDGSGCAWYTAPGSNRIGRLCLHETHLPLILGDQGAAGRR